MLRLPRQVQVTASLWTLAARPIRPNGTERARHETFRHIPRHRDPDTASADQGAARGQRAAGSLRRSLAGSMEVIRLLADEHERIAHDLNDVVVRRLFSAGLDLQAVLNLIGDHRVAGKIERVLGELDLAIRDLRNTVFDRRAT